jgi:hypothetical protein
MRQDQVIAGINPPMLIKPASRARESWIAPCSAPRRPRKYINVAQLLADARR